MEAQQLNLFCIDNKVMFPNFTIIENTDECMTVYDCEISWGSFVEFKSSHANEEQAVMNVLDKIKFFLHDNKNCLELFVWSRKMI